MVQPGHTDPVTHGEPLDARTEFDDLAHHLVTGRHPGSMHRQIPLGDMQIGAAHPARPHADPDLTGCDMRNGLVHQSDRTRHRVVHIDRTWFDD